MNQSFVQYIHYFCDQVRDVHLKPRNLKRWLLHWNQCYGYIHIARGSVLYFESLVSADAFHLTVPMQDAVSVQGVAVLLS